MGKTLEFFGQPAAPFLKWVGGKRMLLEQFQNLFPTALQDGSIHTYAEPFLGGGAIFLHLAERFFFERIYLSDVNPDLILTYRIVQQQVDALIEQLTDFTSRYHHHTPKEQAALYQQVRTSFNENTHQHDHSKLSTDSIQRAAQFIFLNKCGYGGMFRVNQKGHFNVPFGKHKKPQILDEINLRNSSALLQRATLTVGTFCALPKDLAQGAFVYFDPPYRPLNETSHFTGYHGPGFNDDDQERLATLFHQLHTQGALLMLSNSDPKSEDPEDDFFDDLYDGFHIHRVQALRKINSNFARRGRKNEIVITNYL